MKPYIPPKPNYRQYICYRSPLNLKFPICIKGEIEKRQHSSYKSFLPLLGAFWPFMKGLSLQKVSGFIEGIQDLQSQIGFVMFADPSFGVGNCLLSSFLIYNIFSFSIFCYPITMLVSYQSLEQNSRKIRQTGKFPP